MSLESISVGIRAWHPDGKRVPEVVFLDRLLTEPGDPIVSKTKGKREQAARATLLSLGFEEFGDAEEPSEAFAQALRDGLRQAGQWLGKQPSSLFEELRSAGLETDVFIRATIDSDQLDLELPPELLRACGDHELQVSIVTND